MLIGKQVFSFIQLRVLPLFGALFLTVFAPAFADTNLIVNGKFTPATPGCAAGTTSIPGWTVTAGNVDIEDVTCSGIKAADGIYFLDLTGSFAEDGVNDVGTISQTITTVVGQEYRLSFDFGGNPQWQIFSFPNDSSLKAMAVFLNGAISAVYSVQTEGVASTDPQWRRHEIRFKATSTSTEITFQSLNGSLSKPSDFGPLLDNVDVSPVKSEKDDDGHTSH
jgi:choice-of-anchor C domain-containing protein